MSDTVNAARDLSNLTAPRFIAGKGPAATTGPHIIVLVNNASNGGVRATMPLRSFWENEPHSGRKLLTTGLHKRPACAIISGRIDGAHGGLITIFSDGTSGVDPCARALGHHHQRCHDRIHRPNLGELSQRLQDQASARQLPTDAPVNSPTTRADIPGLRADWFRSNLCRQRRLCANQ